MKESRLWFFMQEQVLKGKAVQFLCVLESSGSSPGRQGFKMAVTEDDLMGSIGGGIMEFKFVETARDLIKKNKEETLVKKQVHAKNSSYQSGMICSGEQTIVIYPVTEDADTLFRIAKAIEGNVSGVLQLTPDGFAFFENENMEGTSTFEKTSDAVWIYREKTGYKNYLYIIGGGHVSLALSRLMHNLDFYIKIFDDRKDLNTFMNNDFVHEKELVNYDAIGKLIPEGNNNYVVIMTFGYRSDSVVLRQLIKKNFKYLGLLGSKAKVKKMLEELRDEGVDEKYIKQLHAPIGLQIKSETPEEIAVSIAAEIIQEKNNLDNLKI